MYWMLNATEFFKIENKLIGNFPKFEFMKLEMKPTKPFKDCQYLEYSG